MSQGKDCLLFVSEYLMDSIAPDTVNVCGTRANCHREIPHGEKQKVPEIYQWSLAEVIKAFIK